MIVTHNIGCFGARVKLTALSAAHGKVVRDGLRWCLVLLDDNNKPTDTIIESQDAAYQAELKPGEYHLTAFNNSNEIDLGTLKLAKNTLTDAVYLLNDSSMVDAESEFFAETDPFLEYDRRRQDRDFEIPVGEIVTPVKDPNRPPNAGTQLASHPLLAQAAQFDGIPPEITPDPTENEEATQKAELQLQQQLQQQHAATSSPSTSPSPFG